MRSYHHYKYLVYPFLIISVLVALQCLQSIYGVLPAHQSHVAIDQQTFFLAGLVLFTMIILVCHLLSRDTEKMVIGRTDYSSGAWPGYHDPTTRETAHRDITTAASLSEERTAFLEHLLQNVEESILLINLNGEIVYYNEKARQLFDIPGDRACFQDPAPFQESLESILSHLLSGSTLDEEVTLTGSDKKSIYRHHFQLWNKREQMYIMVTSTDITELAEARSHAETANIAKSQFLANMTHELRTPMIGILGSTELLEQSHLSQEQLESVEVIQECGKHLLAVINEILDVSKMDLGIEQLHLSPTNLRDFLYQTAAMMEALLRDKGLSFELHIDPDLPPAVLADQLKLRQVIVNLLYNAIKFTSRGLIRFEALLLQNGPDCCLQVAVADTGVGIPAGSLENIFDRFYQADNSSHREYGGTGLGLYICKQNVQMMAGQIWAESQAGQGSTFYFRIPLAVVEDNVAADSQPIAGSQKGDEFISEFTPVSVLVVEDNELNQKLLVQMLNNYGFEVATANNGLECLNMLPHQEFDVILMDMQMPVMDGYEATRTIRKESIWDHIPVIAITANAMQGDREKCLACGCSSYLAKPFKSEDLVQEIKNNLKSKYIKRKKSSSLSDQLIANLIPEFIELMGEMMAELEQAIEAKDMVGIQNIGHAIKGTAGMYGFMNMSDIAACIEQNARDQNINKLPMLYNQIASLFKQLSNPNCSQGTG